MTLVACRDHGCPRRLTFHTHDIPAALLAGYQDLIALHKEIDAWRKTFLRRKGEPSALPVWSLPPPLTEKSDLDDPTAG